jgi:RNA polymerase sigma-70 factor (TIGR02957 family)
VTDGLEEFQEQRSHMFGIAYRMLGSVTDAEEVLQEAWLRWQGVDHSQVKDPPAFLARTVTNLCLNLLTSARARREVYVGPWLPEPVLTDLGEAGRLDDLGPLEVATRGESVSFALLTVLERLSAAERAAYVLREAFAYSHREVADLIGTTESNARQLHSRARKRVADERVQRQVDRGQWRTLVERFLAAARFGDVAGLEALLTDGVVSRADGGGRVNAARSPIEGRERVARYLIGVLQRFGAGVMAHFGEANGEPVMIATSEDGLQAVCFFRLEGNRVSGLELVVNPDKLAFADRQLSRIGGLSGLGW